MNWHTRWMDLCKLVASWSKDRSRTCGAVIVNSRNVVVSLGWNGFPRGIDDEIEARHLRPDKYKWTEHAERNAIYNAAASGHPTNQCTLYLSWYPCSDCARAIIQAGISTLVCRKPNWQDPTYDRDFSITKQMFEEVKMNVIFFEYKDKEVEKLDKILQRSPK